MKFWKIAVSAGLVCGVCILSASEEEKETPPADAAPVQSDVMPAALKVSSTATASPSAATMETDAIAASVNGEPVSVRDILQETARQEAIIHATLPLAERGPAILKLRREALDNAINRKLLLAEYKNQTFQIPEQYVESMIDQFALNQAIRSRKEFYAKLREQKITQEQLRKMVEEQLIVQAMTARRMQICGNITPKDVREYFDAHKSELGKEESRELAMIVLGKDSPVRTAPGGLEAFAKQLREDPEKFAALAAVYSSGAGASEGGNLGLLPRSAIRPDFAEACRDAKPGDIVGPVHAKEADYFLKVGEIVPAEEPDFAKMEPVLRKKLEQERRKEVMAEYFQELRKNALIQIYE